MPSYKPEMADHAFEVLNGRPPEQLRAVMFAWHPPNHILIDRCPIGDRTNRNHLNLAEELEKELTTRNIHFDEHERIADNIEWKVGHEKNLESFGDNPPTLKVLGERSPAARTELLSEIQKRI